MFNNKINGLPMIGQKIYPVHSTYTYLFTELIQKYGKGKAESMWDKLYGISDEFSRYRDKMDSLFSSQKDYLTFYQPMGF